MVINMTRNLAHLFEHYGVIPNANRTYLTSRSQPPFFTRMVWLSYEVLRKNSDPQSNTFLQAMITLAEQEHQQVWLGTQQPHVRLVHRGLSRYYDMSVIDSLACRESGWDHTTRCNRNRWLCHLPVDLNSILYFREVDMANAYALLKVDEQANRWSNAADERARTMQELMWDEELQLFCDYDYKEQRCNPHPSLAAFFPLWAGIATPEQAKALVELWLPKFEFDGGLVTTLEEAAGHKWAYPNGWAPLQWLVTRGLDRYGFSQEATRIRRKWCDLGAEVFGRTGNMWETYNVVSLTAEVESGGYRKLPGFGWSNAVFYDFARTLQSTCPPTDPVFHLPETQLALGSKTTAGGPASVA
jgi:alpha,alpha-trehalase